MSRKTEKNNDPGKDFDPSEVASTGPENDLLLDYADGSVIGGRGVKASGVRMPKEKVDRFGDKEKPNSRVHRYHGVGPGILVAILLVIVTLFSVAAGGVFWAWGEYAYPVVNLTLPETVDLVSEMYEVDPDAIVTNPYDPQADLDSFYTTFKEALYLEDPDSVDITLEQILNAFFPEGEDQPDPAGDGTTGSSALDELLLSLHFDFDVLDGATNGELDERVLEVSDKQMAAVLNEAISIYSDKDTLAQFKEQYGVDIAALAHVEQVIISDAQLLDQSQTKLLVTVSLDLANNIMQIAQTIYDNMARPNIGENMGWVNDLAAYVIPKLPDWLPEQLYFTLTVYPDAESADAQITYNNLDEQQQAALDRAMSAIKIEGDDGTQTSLTTMINNLFVSTLDQLNQSVTLSFSNTGAVETKPIEVMLTALGANLTQGQFLAIMRDIEVPFESLYEHYSQTEYAQATRVENLNTFINGEFSDKYYFDNTVDNGDGTFGTYLDAENLFDKIDSLMEDENAIERIGIKTGEDWSEIGDYDAAAHRPLAGYSALPELINGYLRSNGGLGGMSAEVLAAAYYDDGTEEGALQLTISADIRALINDRLTSGESEPDEVLMHFLPQFVPEKLYLNVTYSLGGEGEIGLDINNADENYGEGQSEADLNAIFEFMKVFGVELTFQNAEGETVPINDVSQMKEMLGDMFDSVFVEVGQQLGGDIVMTETGVLFPNIFEVIAANEQLDWSEDLGMSFEDYQRYYEIGDEDLYVILRQMYGYSYTDSNTSEDISAVRSELARKYYLDLESDDSAGLFDEIRELSTSFTSKLRMQTSGSLPGMADDTAATSELLPQIYASDIGMLIQASGSISMADISMIKNVRVLYTTVTSGADGDVMEMILVGDVDTDNITDPDTQQPVENAQKYKTLFPDQMFFSVIVYENGGNEGYDTAYTINDISDSLLTKTMFFIGRFSGDSSVSEEKIGEQINTGVNNAMNDLSVNGAVEIDIAGQPDGSGCITLGTVFSVATGSIWRDENTQEIDEANRPSDDEFRGTIKALWAGMEGYTYSNGEAAANAGYTQETARFLIDGQNVSTRISDAFIASQIGTAEKLEDIASSVGIDPASAAEALALYQTYILPSTSESGAADEITKYNDISGYFADTELLESGEGNLVITLAAKSEFFNTSSEGAVKDNTLLPETIYISAGISLTETGLDNVRMVFNRMTAEQTAILQKIMEYADFDTSAFGDRDGALSSSIASTVLVSQDITVGIDQVYPVRVTVGDLFGQDGETAFNSAVTDTDDYIYEDYNGAKIGLGHIGYIKSISDLIAEAGQ